MGLDYHLNKKICDDISKTSQFIFSISFHLNFMTCLMMNNTVKLLTPVMTVYYKAFI